MSRRVKTRSRGASAIRTLIARQPEEATKALGAALSVRPSRGDAVGIVVGNQRRIALIEPKKASIGGLRIRVRA